MQNIDSDAGQDGFVRLPGLFRRWELELVLTTGTEFHLEDAGQLSDGTELIAVYQRITDSSNTEGNS
jgi:hypothetical protein